MMLYKPPGRYLNCRQTNRLLRPVCKPFIIQVCRSASTIPSQPRLRREFLRWTLIGASAAGAISILAPHSPKQWQRHVHKPSTGSSKSSPESQEETPTSETDHKFPKNTKNLVFVDTADEDANDKENKNTTQRWHGLSFLRSAPTWDEIRSVLSSWTWPASFATLQEKSAALLLELSRGPGSLFSQIVNDPPDPSVHPECQWDAEVRLGDELCVSERAFLRMRRRKMRKAFAQLFGVDERDIDERDLPIVAIAGSGGGFRAMLNTIGSLIGAEENGILNCVTYTAGISGSCWALGVLYSGVSGASTPKSAAEHIADRIQTSYVDGSVLDLLTTPPTNKYLLSGLVRKANGLSGTPSLVDLYGTLLSARLLVPSDLEKLDARCLSLHQFRRNVDDGSLPLPIFTAVLHEIPNDLKKPLAEAKHLQEHPIDPLRKRIAKTEEEEIEELANWLWFEFTPFETGSDDLGAWIPTWALGRRFEKGKSIDRNPALSFSILTGIFASAFCASLQHYINEVQPILRQLPAQFSTWLNEIVMENRKEIGVVHPVEPDEVPNFLKGLDGFLRPGSPNGITERDTLGFMDAGAELNIPYYPLFRRNVDCIIALDASADSQDLWFKRAEQYAARRGIATWPKGARWPALIQSSNTEGKDDEDVQNVAPTPTSSIQSPSEAANRALAEAQETEASGQASKVSGHTGPEGESDDYEKSSENPQPDIVDDASGSKPGIPRRMNSSTIWMGSSAGAQDARETSPLERLEVEDLKRRDGIAIVYNPLIPNDAVPDFDPMSVSTWSFSVGKEDSEKVLKVAEANFMEGHDKIVRLFKAIWLRKKAERERRERDMMNSDKE